MGRHAWILERISQSRRIRCMYCVNDAGRAASLGCIGRLWRRQAETDMSITAYRRNRYHSIEYAPRITND